MSDATFDRVIRHPAVQIVMGALVGLLVTISSYTINRTLDGPAVIPGGRRSMPHQPCVQQFRPGSRLQRRTQPAR